MQCMSGTQKTNGLKTVFLTAFKLARKSYSNKVIEIQLTPSNLWAFLDGFKKQ